MHRISSSSPKKDSTSWVCGARWQERESAHRQLHSWSEANFHKTTEGIVTNDVTRQQALWEECRICGCRVGWCAQCWASPHSNDNTRRCRRQTQRCNMSGHLKTTLEMPEVQPAHMGNRVIVMSEEEASLSRTGSFADREQKIRGKYEWDSHCQHRHPISQQR